MSDNSKFLAGIIVGAAAGAAITLLLNTESGKKVLADLKEAAMIKAGIPLENVATVQTAAIK